MKCVLIIKRNNIDLLSKDEIIWINNYHKKVFERLSRYFSGDELNWLSLKTKEL